MTKLDQDNREDMRRVAVVEVETSDPLRAASTISVILITASSSSLWPTSCKPTGAFEKTSGSSNTSRDALSV